MTRLRTARARSAALLCIIWLAGTCLGVPPALAALQRDLGDDRFEVIALPMDKKSAKSARKILSSWKAENLEPYGHDLEALARALINALKNDDID